MIWFLMACGQSYHDGLVALCDAPLKQPSGEELHQTIDRTVTNRHARALYQGMVQYDMSGVEVLRDEVKAAGLPKCPLIDETTYDIPVELPR